MRPQQGQALLEMLVVTAVILLLGAALLWLQRWQQVKVQTQHHAALSAFRYAVSHPVTSPEEAGKVNYLEGLASPIQHQLQNQYQSWMTLAEWAPLQLGQIDELLGSTNRTRFSVQAVELEPSQTGLAWGLGRPALDGFMRVQSQTTIEVGLGVSHGPQQTLARLQAHGPLWQQTEQGSKTAFGLLTPLLKAVDAGWSRPSPSTQWLAPWIESVPPAALY